MRPNSAGTIGSLSILEKRGLFVDLVLRVSSRIFASVAIDRHTVGAEASGNDVLTEARWVNAHIVDGSEALATLTGPAKFAATGLRSSACLSVGVVSALVFAVPSNATNSAGAIGGSGSLGGTAYNNLGQDISDDAILVGNIMGIVGSSMSGFNVVAVAVFVAFFSMIMAAGTVRVSVSSKDNEAEKV